MLFSWFARAAQTRCANPSTDATIASPSVPTHLDVQNLREQVDASDESGCELRLESYSSLTNLRQRWTALDEAELGSRLSVVLILDDQFNSDIVPLIRRRYMGLQLTVVPLARSLPGPQSIGDLVWTRYQLGWHELAVDRQLTTAIHHAISLAEPDDCLIVFWPESHSRLAEELRDMSASVLPSAVV